MTTSSQRGDQLKALFRRRVLVPLRRTFRHETRTGWQWRDGADAPRPEALEQPSPAPIDADR